MSKGFLYDQIFSNESEEHEIFKTWLPLFKEKKNEIAFYSEKLEKNIEEFSLYPSLPKEEEKHNIYPIKENILKSFYLVKYEDVKCVVWGQDPYPSLIEIDGKKIPRAQGLSFSVHKKDDIPGSLKNIFKNIKNSYEEHFVEPPNGDLSYLCKEGVLFLNICPVYFPYFNYKMYSLVNPKGLNEKDLKKKYDFFMKSWNNFSKNILEILNKKKFCIHLLWGAKAKELAISIVPRHIKLESGHPSSLAQGAKDKFMDNKHFILVNLHLKKSGLKEINWSYPSPSDEDKTYIKYVHKNKLV
jgi:uracil-DNA glycosylase